MKSLRILNTLLLAANLVVAQSAAPSGKCDFHGARSGAPLRQISGSNPVPYRFACGVREQGKCITGSLPAGLVVSVGREENGWACVTGGDSSSGWVELSRLATLPSEPKMPPPLWVGWWHREPAPKGIRNDVLLLTPGKAAGSIRVSGKAFWYGPIVDGQHVEHLGRVNGEAVPIGNHLHIVESKQFPSCVLDLTLQINGSSSTLSAHDNRQCGGMNVNFAGTWKRFTPGPRNAQ